MIISENPKFIRLQPSSCGSATLCSRFKKYENARYPQGEHFNEIVRMRSHEHMALDDFLRPPEDHEDYVPFTFVRNPYDRPYSGFLQRGHRLKNNPPAQRNREKTDRKLRRIE